MNQLPVSATSGLYYKHMMIVNYASSIVNKLKALLTDDAKVVIYNCPVFMVQTTVASAGHRYIFKILFSEKSQTY
jgi:hypothetical protein